jgi:predicted NBD/HSP70 family sugar kinase
LTATWASYLAAGAAALAAALAAVVVLLVGQVAELRRRVAALEPYETAISELLEPATEARSD